MNDVIRLEVKELIFNVISELVEDKSLTIDANTPLIGPDRLLDSMNLVELCVTLEDIAYDKGFEFDWTSDSAMSRSRSMFRSAGTLVEEFVSQMKSKK